jgi:hypothetical protein
LRCRSNDDSDHGKVADNFESGGPRVNTYWKSNDKLDLEIPRLARVFKKLDILGEVEMEYLTN